MTMLKKDMVPVVKLGTPEVQAVVGHPARAAYWSVERTYEQGYLFVEGVTIRKVSVFTLQGTLIAHAPLITGGTIPIWMDLDFVTASAWEYVAYLNGDRLEFSQNTTWDLETNKTIYAYNTNATGLLAARAIPVAQATTFVTETWMYHPAVPAVASVAYRPATPTTIEMSYNAGWNSYAVSIGKVADGQFVEYDIPSGNSGVFVGLGPSSLYGQPLAAFDYGVLADVHGIKVFERGKTVRSLTNNINTRYTVRIHRKDGRVSYTVLSEGAIVATYATVKTVASGVSLIAHGYMYRGGDIIADAEILSTLVKLMPSGFKATLCGAAKLNVFNADAYLRGEATMTVAFNGAKLKGHSYLYEDTSTRTGRIRGFLPPLTALFADSSFSGAISGALPPMQVRLAEEYVPARRQTIDLTLPPLSFSGFMSRSRSGSIEGTIPPVMMKGGSFPYGEISGTLAPLQAIFYEDPMPGWGFLFSSVAAIAPLDGQVDYVFVFNSAGTVIDTYSVSRELAATVLEGLEASGSFDVIGSFSVDFLNNIGYNEFAAATKIKAGGVEVPGVDPGARVWVVNTDTGASVQYDDYGFNSFFERDGEYYGVAEDGIYKLTGDTDAGLPIAALIDTGESNQGTFDIKRLRAVYVGATSSGALVLKLDTDGVERTYYAESRHASDMKNHRFNIGRSQVGEFLRFKVANTSGCDFDLDYISFEPIPLRRGRR